MAKNLNLKVKNAQLAKALLLNKAEKSAEKALKKKEEERKALSKRKAASKTDVKPREKEPLATTSTSKTVKSTSKIDSKNAEALCNLGNLYYISGNLEEAKKCLELSIKNKSDLDAAFNNLGLVNMAYGDFKSAKKNFINTLKINPKNSKAHYNLSNLVNYNIEGKKHLNQLLLNLKLTTFKHEKMYYYFALGKVFEDKKKHKESFQYFKKGNLIKRKSFSYLIKEDKELYSNIKKIFNKNSILSFKNLGFNNDTPIFIVGMPRSGTSLIEQILSSHPDVFGAGEISDLENIISEFFSDDNRLKSLKTLSSLDHNIFNLAGHKYCLKLKKRSINSRFITNKLPLNFRWLGLIKLILPDATIIHCKRHPADTSLSIYQKFFPIYGNEYTFDLVEIAKYYKLYIDLMTYWRKKFPNEFYEIDYENLITDQKNQTIKLLDYCKLSLDKKCFSFSNTHRAVRTSSDIQVRKKIYNSSIGRWKVYKKELIDLMSILNIDS